MALFLYHLMISLSLILFNSFVFLDVCITIFSSWRVDEVSILLDPLLLL